MGGSEWDPDVGGVSMARTKISVKTVKDGCGNRCPHFWPERVTGKNGKITYMCEAFEKCRVLAEALMGKEVDDEQ